MKALSIRQPWAGLLASGIKTVENRRWSTKYRGPLAIHAAFQIDADADLLPHGDGVDLILTSRRDTDGPDNEMPRGVILATVDLIDCHPATDDPDGRCTPWAHPSPGIYHWVLDHPRALAVPVPARGQRGLWDAPDVPVAVTVLDVDGGRPCRYGCEGPARLYPEGPLCPRHAHPAPPTPPPGTTAADLRAAYATRVAEQAEASTETARTLRARQHFARGW